MLFFECFEDDDINDVLEINVIKANMKFPSTSSTASADVKDKEENART